MPSNRIFVSYRREEGEPWPAMAEKFRLKFSNYSKKLDADVFLDVKSIVAGDEWRGSLQGALETCTHFLCLLCDSYWESPNCRAELQTVLHRRAGDPNSVRILFVIAEPLQPAYLQFSQSGASVGEVANVGDFQLLGPFDKSSRIQPLSTIEKWQWSEAMECMIKTITQTLK
jgi:hypothetical protein